MSTRPLKAISVKLPKYGDELYVPSEHPDGHWCNGVVNSGHGGKPHKDGQLLIAAPGHAKANLVAVRIDMYLEHWCWPADVKKKGVGTKRVLLDEVEG